MTNEPTPKPDSSPIHVLHVVEAFGAGTLTAVSCLCQGASEGVRHSVVHAVRPETPSDFARMFPESTQFHAISMQRPISPFKDAAALYELFSLIRRCKPDIVHCHSSKAGVLGRLAARICSVPSVYTPHSYSFLRTDISNLEKSFYRMIEWVFTRFGDAIAACGDEEYALARALAGKRHTVRLIRNSVDLEALTAVSPFAWNYQLPVVGICGRLTPQRNPELFFALAARLQAETSWVWIGGTDEQHNFPPSAHITSWLPRDEALSRIAGLDIYVQTSAWEGLSYSILEAMALGKPVVACKIPSNEAIITHGVTGFLGSNTDELAEYVSMLARDLQLRKTMGAAARQYIAERHHSKTTYQAYADLYLYLAGKN